MDMESKIIDICEMQKCVIGCLKSSFDSGICNVDTVEAGQVADIIKDLSETEKNFYEAKYYKLVAEAMEEKGKLEPTERYGYNYPRIHGNINMGYNEMMDQKPYIDGYLSDPDFKDKMRKGTNEYGGPYNEYMAARRHYTETKSMKDKSEMDARAKEHIDQTIETIEDIWDDASPELKQKMKNDLKKLMDTYMM